LPGVIGPIPSLGEGVEQGKTPARFQSRLRSSAFFALNSASVRIPCVFNAPKRSSVASKSLDELDPVGAPEPLNGAGVFRKGCPFCETTRGLLIGAKVGRIF